jgi:hypothetical protein
MSGSREELGRYEMLWGCAACGTGRLLGLTHRHCPSCGAPQDPTRRYFPPEGEEIAVGDHPYHGADVRCAACDTPNAAAAAHCVNCGSGLDGAKTVGTRAEQGIHAEDDAKAAAHEHAERRQAERESAMRAHALASGADPGPEPAAPRGGRWKVVVGVLVAVAVLLFVVFGWTREAALEVTGHRWARGIAVEELRAERDSAWRDSIPAGAYMVSNCRRDQRSVRQVPDGEDCSTSRVDKGDGSFSKVETCTPRYRAEPVYDTRCDYFIDRWVVVDEARTSGTALTPAPAWPPTPPTTGRGLGARRPGRRTETYTALFKDAEGKDRDCALPEARWGALAVHSRWKGDVGVVTGALDCDTLKPVR